MGRFQDSFYAEIVAGITIQNQEHEDKQFDNMNPLRRDKTRDK
jgi:hypothetical protein